MGVGLFEERLPLEVGFFDEIAIDHTESAHAGANQEVGNCCPQRSAANQGRAGRGEPLLAFFADTGEQNLPRISFV